MSWENFKKSQDEASNFIKLKDGQEVVGVFVGDPYCFYQKFKDRTEYPKWVEGASFKFRINFILKENDVYVAKIFQGGATIRDQLLAAKEEYGLDCSYKIKRKGSGKEDTVYSVLFKGNLSEEQKKEIHEMKLKALTKKSEEMSTEDILESSDEEIPF